MTARPDEVVAWIEVTDTPYGEGLSFSDAANQPRGRYVQESALQSANARLAESEAGRDEWMRGAESMHKRLAAVLALADEWTKRANDLIEHHQHGKAAELDSCIDELRRAAAGEGDANQGDGE